VASAAGRDDLFDHAIGIPFQRVGQTTFATVFLGNDAPEEVVLPRGVPGPGRSFAHGVERRPRDMTLMRGFTAANHMMIAASKELTR